MQGPHLISRLSSGVDLSDTPTNPDSNTNFDPTGMDCCKLQSNKKVLHYPALEVISLSSFLKRLGGGGGGYLVGPWQRKYMHKQYAYWPVCLCVRVCVNVGMHLLVQSRGQARKKHKCIVK